jgi:hypothetical protein
MILLVLKTYNTILPYFFNGSFALCNVNLHYHITSTYAWASGPHQPHAIRWVLLYGTQSMESLAEVETKHRHLSSFSSCIRVTIVEMKHKHSENVGSESAMLVLSHSTLVDEIYPLLSVRDILSVELVCRATRLAVTGVSNSSDLVPGHFLTQISSMVTSGI